MIKCDRHGRATEAKRHSNPIQEGCGDCKAGREANDRFTGTLVTAPPRGNGIAFDVVRVNGVNWVAVLFHDTQAPVLVQAGCLVPTRRAWVQLDYYKEGGKYYSSGEAEADNPQDAFDAVRVMMERRELPGLVKGHSEFTVLATVRWRDDHGLDQVTSRLFVPRAAVVPGPRITPRVAVVAGHCGQHEGRCGEEQCRCYCPGCQAAKRRDKETPSEDKVREFMEGHPGDVTGPTD